MSKEQTPIELINSMREQIAINEMMHDYTCSSEWVRCFLDQLEESVKTDTQTKVLEALEIVEKRFIDWLEYEEKEFGTPTTQNVKKGLKSIINTTKQE